MTDPFQLSRFVAAQEPAYEHARRELRAGAKTGHWMWFIFPQLDGLGRSPTARHYAIKNLEEARAYLDHPILGARLRECAQALLALPGKSAAAIFGSPDDLKLRSSMTLFARAAGSPSVFAEVLGAYFDDQPDERTVELLRAMEGWERT
jgi:uncharacterized protein (DUF1810 family)